MPIYEYNCENCRYTFDKLVMNRDVEVHCPLCQGEVKKLMSMFSVQNRLPNSVSMGTEQKMCTSCA
jgi:putative FmdB family regulatory protein